MWKVGSAVAYAYSRAVWDRVLLAGGGKDDGVELRLAMMIMLDKWKYRVDGRMKIRKRKRMAYRPWKNE